MKKHLLTLSTIALLAVGCGGGTTNNNASTDNQSSQASTPPAPKTNAVKPAVYPNWETNKGIGKVKTITPPLSDTPDATMAEKGKDIFYQYCIACHQPKRRMIGPAMAGITDYRTPEWIMNMILSPEVMIKQDPIAKAQFEEYGSIMLNQNLTEQQARELLEYLRTIK